MLITREQLREEHMLADDATILEPIALDLAICGVTTDGRIVYSYESLVTVLQHKDGMNEEQAIEWIEYNTIRSLPYMGEHAPIIIHHL